MSGPGGSGKTSLIAGYLEDHKIPSLWYQIDPRDNDPATFFYYLRLAASPFMNFSNQSLPLFGPEYLSNIESFGLNFFEKLCPHLPLPMWLVFDNFQELSATSPLLMILSKAIEVLPSNVVTVIISRNNPPVEMARLKANRILYHIGADKLIFSLNECQMLSELLDTELSCDEVNKLHGLTGGWCAGLILWLMRLKLVPETRQLAETTIPDSVFDYFAGEVLAQIDDQTRRFLLQTALLPCMTVESVEQLTQMAAGKIFDELHRRNFFIEKRQTPTLIYQYHPLFHNFLKNLVYRELETKEVYDFQRRGAAIMARNGLTEEAVALYNEALAYESLSGLILAQAPQLFAQGRFLTLADWIAFLPEEIVSQNPWLLYWQSMTVMLNLPPQGQALCIASFEGFKKTGDLMGQIISWSSIVESFLIMRGIFTDLDRWITEGERLGELLSPELDGNTTARFMESMLVALMLRNLAHPKFPIWQERCEEILSRIDNQEALAGLGFKLIWSYHWMGQVHKARTLIKRLQSTKSYESGSPLAQCGLRMVMASMYGAKGQAEKCRREIDEVASLARQSGIHVYDFVIFTQGVYNAILIGDLDEARSYLRRVEKVLMPHALWDLAHYHFQLAAIALLAKDWDEAEVHINTSCTLAEKSGTPFPQAFSTIQQAHYLLERGRLAPAQEALDRIEAMNVPQHNGFIYFLRELVLADCAWVQQQIAVMQTHLRAAFSFAAKNGLQMPAGLLRSRLASLCLEALKVDIHIPIVTQLISCMRLPPPQGALTDEKWPWPLKCRTLGCFEVLRNNQPIEFTTKTPRKPLELLKLLICRSHYKSSRETIADQLWPDADGDRAIQNINTTLHRLRKLLGDDQAILLDQGYLSLNPDIFWVDAWQFKSIAEQAEKETAQATRTALLFKALEIYNGHFIDTDDYNPWIVGYSDHLRSLWRNTVNSFEKLMCETGQLKKVKKIRHKILMIDETSTPL
ncbi:hypothetical protein [Desulfobacter curvatus]|uniref:hypothetical protein n=1 Tax=Desulfobacter curvatus TaxID=2290 RepID=UPI0012FA83EC|nr:hypothetical protein [Desulfobacter curvatus]